jgi:hypothetical protein
VGKLRARTKQLLEDKGILHPSQNDDQAAEERDDAVSDSPTASIPKKTIKGSKKRKQNTPTLSSNDIADDETAFSAAAAQGLMPPPTKKPRAETSVVGAAPEAWMTADSLKNLEGVQAAVQMYLDGKAREQAEKHRRKEATAAAATSENDQEGPVGEQGVGEEAGTCAVGTRMEGGAAAAGETALSANDAGGAGIGGDGASAGGDGEAEIDPNALEAAQKLMLFMSGGRSS